VTLDRVEAVEEIHRGRGGRRRSIPARNYKGPYDKAPDADNLRTLATGFQSGVKVPNPDELCQIPSCKSTTFKVTAKDGW